MLHGCRINVASIGLGLFPCPWHCAGKNVVNGHANYCRRIGGVQIDDAVARAVLAALEPLGLEAVTCSPTFIQSKPESLGH
jgi:hypothetical protein